MNRFLWGILLGAILLLSPLSLFAAAVQPPSLALLVSRNIKPYIEAAEGFLVEMGANSDARIDTFFMENYTEASEPVLAEKIRGMGSPMVVAIGPEAARFAHEKLKGLSLPILYGMVLNPEKILEEGEKNCGVPLNIPISAQLEAIASHLPEVKKIGLLYDPDNNEDFYRKSKEIAASYGIGIIPLRVGSRSRIPEALQKGQQMDGMWLIPDRTVISESIVQYIIKEMILQGVPTIGYNRFFYDSGAALAFIFDYTVLGRQTAELAISALSGSSCPYAPPIFSTMVNQRVLERLEISPAKQEGGYGQ